MASSFEAITEDSCERCGRTEPGCNLMSYRVRSHQNLCRTCARDATVEANVTEESVWACPDHAEMTVEFYCITCQRGACRECDHSNAENTHEVISRERAAPYFYNALMQKLGLIEEKKRKVEEWDEKLRNCKSETAYHFKVVYTKMTDSMAEKKKLITDRLVAETDRVNKQFDLEMAELKRKRESELKDLAKKALCYIETVDQRERHSAHILESSRSYREEVLQATHTKLLSLRRSCDAVMDLIRSRSHLDHPETLQKALREADCVLAREQDQDSNVASCLAKVRDGLPRFKDADGDKGLSDGLLDPGFPILMSFLIFFLLSDRMCIWCKELNSATFLTKPWVHTFLETECVLSLLSWLIIVLHIKRDWPMDIQYSFSTMSGVKVHVMSCFIDLYGLLLCTTYNLVFIISANLLQLIFPHAVQNILNDFSIMGGIFLISVFTFIVYSVNSKLTWWTAYMKTDMCYQASYDKWKSTIRGKQRFSFFIAMTKLTYRKLYRLVNSRKCLLD